MKKLLLATVAVVAFGSLITTPAYAGNNGNDKDAGKADESHGQSGDDHGNAGGNSGDNGNSVSGTTGNQGKGKGAGNAGGTK